MKLVSREKMKQLLNSHFCKLAIRDTVKPIFIPIYIPIWEARHNMAQISRRISMETIQKYISFQNIYIEYHLIAHNFL